MRIDVAMALVLLLPGPASAGEDVAGEPRRCVAQSQIERVRIVSDNALLFYLRGGEVWMNLLTHRCHGLKSANRYLARPSGGQVCDGDRITVLEDSALGFIEGPSCVLGAFRPADGETKRKMPKAGE